MIVYHPFLTKQFIFAHAYVSCLLFTRITMRYFTNTLPECAKDLFLKQTVLGRYFDSHCLYFGVVFAGSFSDTYDQLTTNWVEIKYYARASCAPWHPTMPRDTLG